MKNTYVQIKNLVFAFLLTSFFFQSCAFSCRSEGKGSKYLIEEYSLGRLIVLWIDNTEGSSLKITIDNHDQETISLPGQACISPLLGFTEEGHIVVVWAGKIPGKELYTFYGAKLPYKGKWSTPEIITESDEQVIVSSHQLLVTDSNKISVFWEAINFVPSEVDPEVTGHQKYLRCLKGSFQSWGSHKNIALLRRSDQ